MSKQKEPKILNFNWVDLPDKEKPKETTQTGTANFNWVDLPDKTGGEQPYVGVTEPEYPKGYQTPEGFVDYDSLGTTREERIKKAQEQLGVKQPPPEKQFWQTTPFAEPTGQVIKSKTIPVGRQFPGQIPFVDTPEEKEAQVNRFIESQPLMKKWALQFGKQYSELQADKISKATDELETLQKTLELQNKKIDLTNPEQVNAYNEIVNKYNKTLEEQGVNLKELEKGYNLINGVMNANKLQAEQRLAGTQGLIQGVKRGLNEPGMSGLPLSAEIFSQRQTEIQEDPEKMSEQEALNYYKTATENSPGLQIAGEKVTPQKLMSGSYKFIPSFVKNYIDPVVKELFPEQYRFLKADQLRKKEGAENYAEYGANMIGELAGLFAFAGPIHEGYNTMGAIGRLAKTNPRVANALSSFLAGGTYSALTNAPEVSEGKMGVGGAVADAIATGIVFSAFSQVGTKDWLKLTKSGEAQLTFREGAFESFKLAPKPGQEKLFLSKQIGNWLIDTGAVTGVSAVSNKVAMAVDESERNNTPLVEELQKQFTNIDLTQLGIEFAINAMFTGGIPQQYGKPQLPLEPGRQIGKEPVRPIPPDRTKIEPPKGGKDAEVTGEIKSIIDVNNYFNERDRQKGNRITELAEQGKSEEEIKKIIADEFPSPSPNVPADEKINLNPTDAQKEAGNYKMAHIKKDGFDITVENTKGSIRSGKDDKGREWQTEMQNDYGYIKGTVGKDKDHLDTFLADNYKENSPVFVVNQTKPDGSFDEHKVMLGFTDANEAEQAYLSNYEKGWDNYSDVVEMSQEQFKEWSKDQKLTKKPAQTTIQKPRTKQELAEYNKLQAELMQEAGIPEEDMPDYVGSSVADGEILGDYARKVQKGEITKDEAIERVKTDYEKMKSGEKEAKFIEPENKDNEELIKHFKSQIAILNAPAKDATKTDIQKADRETKAYLDIIDKLQKGEPLNKTQQKYVDDYYFVKKSLQKQPEVASESTSEGKDKLTDYKEVNKKTYEKIKPPEGVRLVNVSGIPIEEPMATAIDKINKDIPNGERTLTASSGFHTGFEDNGKWAIVFNEPSEQVKQAAENVGLKYRERNPYADVYADELKVEEQKEAKEIFDKFADELEKLKSKPTVTKTETVDNNKATAMRLFKEGKTDKQVVTAIGDNSKAMMDKVREWRKEYGEKFVKDHIVVGGIKPAEKPFKKEQDKFVQQVQEIKEKNLLPPDIEANQVMEFAKQHPKYPTTAFIEVYNQRLRETKSPREQAGKPSERKEFPGVKIDRQTIVNELAPRLKEKPEILQKLFEFGDEIAKGKYLDDRSMNTLDPDALLKEDSGDGDGFIQDVGKGTKSQWILSDKGQEIYNKLKAREATREGVRKGEDLFPEYAGIPIDELLEKPEFQEEINEEENSRIKSIEEQTEAITSKTESLESDESRTEQLQEIDDLIAEIDEELRLQGVYEAAVTAQETRNEADKLFKKDLKKFAKEIQKGLGYEPDRDKKGKDTSVSINIAPVGGDGTIILWKPNSDYGVYIDVGVDRDYVSGEYEDKDKLTIRSMVDGNRFMWRVTTKQNKYTGLGNQWVQKDVTAGEFARLIKRAVDEAEAQGIKKFSPTIGTPEEQRQTIKDLQSGKTNVTTAKPERKPKPSEVEEGRPFKGTIYDKNLEQLKKVMPYLDELKQGDHFRLVSKPYMPLTVEVRENTPHKMILYLSHNYIQNGDLMDDPFMSIRIDKNNHTVEALEFQQSSTGTYGAVYPEEGKVNLTEKSGQNSFLNMWLKNLEAQGFGESNRIPPNKVPIVEDYNEEYWDKFEGKDKQVDVEKVKDEIVNDLSKDEELQQYLRQRRGEIPDKELAGNLVYKKLSDWLDKNYPDNDVIGRRYSGNTRELAKAIYEKITEKPKEEVEKSPDANLVDAIYNRLQIGKGVKDNPDLTSMADIVYGGTRAQGKYQIQDAYNALEAAVNKWIAENNIYDLPVDEALSKLRDLLKKLPTQTSRSAEKDLFQQFSTPPTLSYFAAKLLNPNSKDVILEPSAGTGSLISFIRDKVAKVFANEIDPKRKALLEYLGFETSGVDAEFINSLLPQNITPTKIIMNPPFSATGGRVKQNKNLFGYKHLQDALARLQDGGRLVAILGEGAEFGKPEADRLFWNKVVEKFNVRADIGIANNDYGKYGTSFGNRVIVIDKTGPTPNRRPELQGNYETIEEALNAAERIISSSPTTLGTGKEDVLLDERPQEGGAIGTSTRGGSGGRVGGSGSVSGNTGKGRTPKGDKNVEGEIQPERDEQSTQPTESEVGGQRKPSTTGTGTGKPDSADSNRPTGNIEYEKAEATEKKTESSGFVEYKPSQKPTDSVEHPANLVETASMAAVEIPKITYKPNLPEEVVKKSKLKDENVNISDAQLETIGLIGQRHNLIFENGTRAGFFVGDGTGVGKGRIVAGTIFDNWRQGRKKALWVSYSPDLLKDARRDLDGVGAKEIPINIINQYVLGEKIPDEVKGVIFTTYSSLISEKGIKSRLKDITDWLDDDGVIIFDEAHKAKNLFVVGRGSEPTKTATTVVKLQDELKPKARVVYASATGATDVRHMGYMTRLGIWGKRTPFPSFHDFMVEIGTGGIGAMEMVARDLKALGIYSSRTISYEGIEYVQTEHELTPDQRRIYNTAAEGWQVAMQDIEAAIEVTDAKKSQRFINMKFWGAHQRFFKQVLTALKVPTLLKNTDEYLAQGKSVVIQMIGTQESSTKRKVNELLSEGGDLDDLDLSPREILAQMIENAFPTTQYERYTDENGNEKTRPLVDAQGNPVQNPEAVKMKEKLLNKIGDINLPENPLDQIVNYYELRAKNEGDSTLRVAELSGRKKRLVKNIIKNPDPNAKEKFIFGDKITYQKRVPKDISQKDANTYETKQFQGGQKRVSVITGAASTGITLSSDKTARNKQQRVHVLFEPPWAADVAMQFFGRTHRSNQEVPPIYDLLTTDAGGEKRFASTIAKRLASLGALTKGERGSAGGGQYAKYNFENEYGEAALNNIYYLLESGREIPGIENNREVLKKMGVLKGEPPFESVQEEDKTNVTLFLNRILGLEVDIQNALFNRYNEEFGRVIEAAKESGGYDEGVTDLEAESIKIKKQPETVHTDELTKAETKHYELSAVVKTYPVSFKEAKERMGLEEGRAFYKQTNSGSVVLKLGENTRTDPKSGKLIASIPLLNPSGNRTYVTREDFNDKYEKLENFEAEPIWKAKYELVPKTKTEEVHILSGAILPLWKNLKVKGHSHIKVVRAITDDKQRIVGVQLPNDQVGEILRSLHIKRDLREPDEIFTAVLEQGEVVNLMGELQLKKVRVSGEDRIELIGTGSFGIDSERIDEFKEKGLIFERIQFKPRLFVPTDKYDGPFTLRRLLRDYPPLAEGEEPLSAKPKLSEGWNHPEYFESMQKALDDNPFLQYYQHTRVPLSYRYETFEGWLKIGYNPIARNFYKVKKGETGYVEGKEIYRAINAGRLVPSFQGGRIEVSDEEGVDSFAHENAHAIEIEIGKRDRGLQQDIQRWKEGVAEIAKKYADDVPEEKELFVEAYLAYLGWNPEIKDVYKLPPSILERVNKIASASKTGKDNLPAMMAKSYPRKPQAYKVKSLNPEKKFTFEGGRLVIDPSEQEGQTLFQIKSGQKEAEARQSGIEKPITNEAIDKSEEMTFGIGLGQVIPEISDAIKNIADSPAIEAMKGSKFVEQGKRLFNQFITPPPVEAELNPDFAPLYRTAEKKLNRDYVYDQNVVLKNTMRNFKDFRKLSDADQKELMRILSEYHYDIYRRSFFATSHLRGGTLDIDGLIDKYRPNVATEKVLRQLDNLGKQTLELTKQGEKEMLVEFKKKISNVLTEEEFLELFPEFRSGWKYIEDDPRQVIDAIWNNDPQKRAKIADFLVERKYEDWGKSFYVNLSRPLEKDHYLVSIAKPLNPNDPQSPKERQFTYFESRAEADKFVKEMESDGWTLTSRIARVDELLKNQSDWERLDQSTLLHLFNTSNVEIPKEVINDLMRNIKEGYWEKHTIRRNYTPGLKWKPEELEQNIVNLLAESSSKKNKTLGIAKLDKALLELEERYGKAVRDKDINEKELRKLKQTLDYAQRFVAGLKIANNRSLDTIRGIMYLWDLGFFRPSFMLQQTTENVQTVMNLAIAEGGLGAGEASFIKAGKDTGEVVVSLINEKIGKPILMENTELWEVITRLRDMEKITPLGAKVLFGESGDPKIHYDTVGKGFDAIRNILGSGGQAIEYITRIQAAATFYRIAKQKGMRDIDKITQYIADMIDLSKANYAKTGTIVALNPRTQKDLNEKTLGRAISQTFLVYKKWASANTGLYRLLWNKSKTAFLIKALVGAGFHGVKKFPVLAGLLGIASLILGLMNEDVDKELQDIENDLNEKVGGNIGSLLNRGAGTYFNADISGLMQEGSALPSDVLGQQLQNIRSLQELIYDSPRIITESTLGRPFTFSLDLLNGALSGVQLATQDLSDKERIAKEKKVLKSLPSTIRSAMQTGILQEEGLKYGAKQVIRPGEIEERDLITRQLGFQPEEFSKRGEMVGAVTPMIRKSTDKAIEYIRQGRNREARKEFEKLFEEVKKIDPFTIKQKEKIETLQQFIGGYVLNRLSDNDRKVVKEWKDENFYSGSGRGNSRDRGNRGRNSR